MKILHLTLTKKWFDMIAHGAKKEEYREVTDYWKARLHDKDEGEYLFFTDFDIVRFKNGYQKDAPTMDLEWKDTQVRSGNPLLGAIEHKPYYVIELGKILKIENYELIKQKDGLHPVEEPNAPPETKGN